MLCNELLVKKLKSHEGSQRVTKGNVKGHPTLCYKQNCITHIRGFWELSFCQALLREGLESIVMSLGFSTVHNKYVSSKEQAMLTLTFHYWGQQLSWLYVWMEISLYIIQQSQHVLFICCYCSSTILVTLAMYVVLLMH